jgi:hypothetical protein
LQLRTSTCETSSTSESSTKCELQRTFD